MIMARIILEYNSIVHHSTTALADIMLLSFLECYMSYVLLLTEYILTDVAQTSIFPIYSTLHKLSTLLHI